MVEFDNEDNKEGRWIPLNEDMTGRIIITCNGYVADTVTNSIFLSTESMVNHMNKLYDEIEYYKKNTDIPEFIKEKESESNGLSDFKRLYSNRYMLIDLIEDSFTSKYIIKDNDNPYNVFTMNNICALLNKLDYNIHKLQDRISCFESENNELKLENEFLQNQIKKEE